ncbi:unnamed protein product [Thlaspi arvense]|uniref:Bulb-type lectin domain-containing protein n=1 Tax=Thlaspi arvense TaxID=13288 RepID=A0AAU9RF46_THLAR|nr:unnamed protein product [Thlaspi arvense]
MAISGERRAAISRESPLSLGQTLSSPSGSYELGFFTPNNSQNQYVGIWFKKVTPRVVVWVANREKPITNPVANLTISGNGSLILLDSRKNVVWSTRKASTSNKCHAKLLDTGNLVIIDDASGNLLWQSFENPGDTLLPLSSLMYNLATGEKRVLTSYKSHNDPSPGDFVVQLTPQVPAQIVTMKGSKLYKRSGPWAKTGFTGVPQMDESYTSPFSLFQDVGNGTGSFSYIQRNSELTRVIITSEGYLKTFRYNGTGWVLDFVTPANSCDLYGACGPFGLCVTSIPIKCKCMKGFVPKHKEEWKRGNMTSGCVRRTELSCQANLSTKTQGKGGDVFYRLANLCFVLKSQLEAGEQRLLLAWESWLETGGVDLLDQDITSSCSPVEVARCVQIGLLCIQQQAIDRPNVAQVVSMITTETELPIPKQPVFALQIQDHESGVSVSESVNDLTQTAIHGR